MKRIVVIGLGGVGGYFGFKLSEFCSESASYDIGFVARGETLHRIKNNGLKLISPEHKKDVTHPKFLYSSISEIDSPDLLLICVKEYDLEKVCSSIKHRISDQTIILPMMNGADIYERVRNILPVNTILPSCVYVASHIMEKGIIEHQGKPGKLIFGKDPENLATDIDWIIQLLQSSQITFQFKENSEVDIWTKYIFIASFGLVSAKFNSSIGIVSTEENQKLLATKIMNEIKAIADKKGINLPDDIINTTFEKASTFPFSTPTSFQLDVHSSKKNNELELFAGTIIRYGTELDVPTPETTKIYNELRAMLNKS